MKKRYNFKELNETTHDCQWPNGVKQKDALKWVDENIQGEYLTGAAYITFFDKEDAFLYRMTWA